MASSRFQIHFEILCKSIVVIMTARSSVNIRNSKRQVCNRKYRLDDELRFLCDLDHHGNCLINRGRSPRLINVSKVI